MSTVFTHAFVGFTAAHLAFPALRSPKFILLSMACAALPDLDAGLHAYGVEYEDAWGHRGMMHSLCFAAILAFVIASWPFKREARFLSGRWCLLWLYFTAVAASHGFIDMFTDGGLGIAILAPFDDTRHFMPWRPLAVPDLGIAHLFTRYTAHVLLTELLWVWSPLIALLIVATIVRRHWCRGRVAVAD